MFIFIYYLFLEEQLAYFSLLFAFAIILEESRRDISTVWLSFIFR